MKRFITQSLIGIVIGLGIVALVTVLTGCAAKKPHAPVTYVFHNCKTVEELHVKDVPSGKEHVELTCTCGYRVEKLDAKTNRMVVECLQ
jgi:hypothetical protein